MTRPHRADRGTLSTVSPVPASPAGRPVVGGNGGDPGTKRVPSVGRAVAGTVGLTVALMAVLGVAGTVGYLAGLTGHWPSGIAMAVLTAVLVAWLSRGDRGRRLGFVRPGRVDRSGALVCLLGVTLVLVPVVTATQVQVASVAAVGLVVVALLVGFVEETVFRAVLPRLFPTDRPVLAVVVPTIAFAAAHTVTAVSPDQSTGALVRTVLFALFFGLLAALTVRATGSVWPAVALHAAFDAAGFLLAPRDALTTDTVAIVVAAAGCVLAVLVLRQSAEAETRVSTVASGRQANRTGA